MRQQQPYYYQPHQQVPPPSRPGRIAIWIGLILAMFSVGCFLYVVAIWANDQSNALMMAADSLSMIRLGLIGIGLLALSVLVGLMGVLIDGR